jgi:hypothetical protein
MFRLLPINGLLKSKGARGYTHFVPTALWSLAYALLFLPITRELLPEPLRALRFGSLLVTVGGHFSSQPGFGEGPIAHYRTR